LRITAEGILMSMTEPAPIVYVVDDDPDVLKAIERLLESVELKVVTFPSPQRFLEATNRTLLPVWCSTLRCRG
jgi:FixJ family two-component response regulator